MAIIVILQLMSGYAIAIAVVLIILELMIAYAIALAINQKFKNIKLIKTALVVDAIASLQSSGYGHKKAKNSVLELCKNRPPEIYEPLLRSLATGHFLLRHGDSEEIFFLDSAITIGDARCKYNARSHYIRCAIAPQLNSCKGCKDYSPTR